MELARLRRLTKTQQLDLLRLIEAKQRVIELQGRPILDCLRAHFLAEHADQNRKGAALVLVRSIAEQSKDPVIRTTAESAGYLLDGRLGYWVSAADPILLSFGDSISALKRGSRVCRESWVTRRLWIELEVPDHEAPRLVIVNEHGRERWHPSHTDILASDWVELPQVADSPQGATTEEWPKPGADIPTAMCPRCGLTHVVLSKAARALLMGEAADGSTADDDIVTQIATALRRHGRIFKNVERTACGESLVDPITHRNASMTDLCTDLAHAIEARYGTPAQITETIPGETESETDYEALKRILAPVLNQAQSVDSDGLASKLLSYRFPDPRSPESRDDGTKETTLSFSFGPSDRLDIVTVEGPNGTAAYQVPREESLD